MGYLPIADGEVDAESPITESLMTRLRDNALAFAQLSFTVLNGSGTYTVPDGITKLRVIAVSGGGGGGTAGGSTGRGGGGGGGGGRVVEIFYTTTGGASISYSCGAGGAAASQGGSTTFGTLTVTGGHAGGTGNGSNYFGIGGNTGAIHVRGWSSGGFIDQFGAGNTGNEYCGGHGGHGSHQSIGVATQNDGGTRLPVSGTAGSGYGQTNVNYGGGGGAPMSLPFYIDGVDAYLGSGGSATAAAGTAATLYGGGGGGGTIANSGGAGSAGIIFVLPIG
jgi:hypothetical protein